MLLQEQQELESQYMMQTYGRKPVAFVRGKGMRLYDDTGKEYLDFIAGIGAVSVGHANANVVSAMQNQAAKLMHVSNYYYVEGRGELANKLSNLLSSNANAKIPSPSPWCTFFANSGTEAVEGAIKIARKYGVKHLDGATTIITARRSFHGRTLAALAATGQASKQESFAPLTPGFLHVDLNDIAALKQALHQGVGGATVCAVMLECIQGEGGVYPCTTEYLQAARELTAEKDILLMIDEVQTGFYRLGSHPFAFMHHDIVPDVVAMAKGIANGMPMGAVAVRGAADVFEPGDHGSTFGGNPLAIAAANATIDELVQKDIGSQVSEVGAYLQTRLTELPGVSEIRGKGLMLGIEFVSPIAEQIVTKASEQGLLINQIGHHIVRLLPPLICTKVEVDLLMERLAPIVEELTLGVDR